MIPKHHAYALTMAWKGKTTILEVNEDHNTIMDNEDIWKKIEEFSKENLN